MRTKADENACDSKVLYDVEFEAELAAVKFESHSGEKMRAYRCPGTNHFHITHVDKEKQGKKRLGKTKCVRCGVFVRNNKYRKHIVAHNKKGEYEQYGVSE